MENDITGHLSIFIFKLFVVHQFENYTRSDCSFTWSLTELTLIYIFKSSANNENVQKLNICLTSFINNKNSNCDKNEF